MSGEEQPDVFFLAMGDETINDEEAGTATRDGVGVGKLWSGMDGF